MTLTELFEKHQPALLREGIDAAAVNVLALLFENWLKGESAASSDSFRSKFFKRKLTNCLKSLERAQLVREEAQLFSLTFAGYAVLLLHRRRAAQAMRATFDHAFRYAKRGMDTQPDIKLASFDEVLASAPPSVTSNRLFTALTLAQSGSGLGIGMGRDPEGQPMMTFYLEAQQLPNVAAAIDYTLELMFRPRTPFLMPLEMAAFSLESLALAPDAHANARKALDRLAGDPSGAITSARTTLESTFRWIAFQAGREIVKDATARDMLNACKDLLGLDGDALVRLLGAVNNVCNQIWELRNTRSDAHAQSPAAAKASRSQARFIATTSLMLAAFLLERFEAKNTL
ncbi:MAG: abortive infection family protein [Ramlibacter sp.]